jgi:hypothetical protein
MRNIILLATSLALTCLLLAAPGCQTTTVGPGNMVTGLNVPLPPQPVPVASSVRERSAKAARAAQKENEEITDPCATRLQDIITSLYLYYAAYKQLPNKLEDLRTVTGIETDLGFTCPVSGKPYIYNPVGLQAQAGDTLHLILYDATPAHNGCRWGVVMGPTPNRDGRVFYQMDVVKLTSKVFDSFKQVPAPLTQPAPETNQEPQVQDLGVLHQKDQAGQGVQTPPGQ